MLLRLLRLSAGLASLLVVLMFLVFAFSGVGQESLQVFLPPEEWVGRLTANPAALRLTLALDNAFIFFYLTTFLALGLLRWPARTARPLTVLAVGLLCVTGALDLHENLEFLTRLAAAQVGVVPSPDDVVARVVGSLLKFHCSYFGLWLLGHALPATSGVERGLTFGLKWVQWPVGLAIAVAPRWLAVLLVIVRLVFFFVALLALRRVVTRPGFDSAEPGASAVPAGG